MLLFLLLLSLVGCYLFVVCCWFWCLFVCLCFLFAFDRFVDVVVVGGGGGGCGGVVFLLLFVL